MSIRTLLYIKRITAKRFVLRLTIGALLLLSTVAGAQPMEQFTNSHPLIIAGPADFPPYDFLSSDGHPTGHDIDILDAILGHIHIPHKFVLADWDNAAEMFERKAAHLILDPYGIFNSQPYYVSSNCLGYYKFMVASRTSETSISSTAQLTGIRGVSISCYDKKLKALLNTVAPDQKVEEYVPKEALVNLLTNTSNYFIWAEGALKHKVKELSLANDIALSEINIPARGISFVGHDSVLVDQLDDLFARMQQHGELEQIRDKWMHPEREHNDTPLVAIYITLIVLLAAFGLLMANRLTKRRLMQASRKAADVERTMRQALSMGQFQVTQYDVKADLFTNRHGHLLPEEGITWQQFLDCIHPDDRVTVKLEMEKLLHGQNGIWEINARCNLGIEGSPKWIHMHGYAIAEQDESGRTRYIVSAVKDVTKDNEEERKENEMGAKYVKMFDSTLVAMSFYDKDGRFVGLNQNMRKLCEEDSQEKNPFENINLFELPYFRDDFDRNSRECFHVCQHMAFPEQGIDKYIEVRVLPVYDNDILQHYIITARDVTEERNMYMELRRQDTELRRKNDIINSFERQLHYLLENSNMWVWRSDLKEKRIYLSQSLTKDEYSQTFEDYMNDIDERFRAQALEAYGNMKGTEKHIDTVLLFKHTPVNPLPHWCALNGMPVFDAQGRVTGHFGVVRDVTTLMEAQEQLKRETARAEDSGRMKSVFLANMTHEIRTPLNAIVGFSDLLQMIDEPEERREFIRIIRNNCDMLIRLINDIIEASTMNQGPLAIESSEVDFAVAFNDICQTLAQRVQEPGVEFIVDNPYQSFITRLDKGRMQQVITNFTTNAVKYTHQGHIKVGYDYLSFRELKERVADSQIAMQDMPFSGIFMYCEDTGTGIPREKQAIVFDRFVKLNDYVQGTGLGLSICKSIAERCAGRIGVSSEGEGHGSTFWIWIPCERKTCLRVEQTTVGSPDK